MHILLTNDDGIDSVGLSQLRARLEKNHEVWVVAPGEETSGSSHAITLREPNRMRKISEQIYVCFGTPADCVLRACLGIVPVTIDLIISGINLGPNLGTDIIYSGTAAGARQGALMNIASVAASVTAYKPPFEFEYPVEFIARNIDEFVKLWSPNHFLNINFPANLPDEIDVAVTFPARRIYKDKLINFTAPNGDIYSFIGGEVMPESHDENGSDSDAVSQGKISLSPVFIHPINHDVEEKYRRAHFWREI